MTENSSSSGTAPALTAAEIRDILLYVASWNGGLANESSFNGVRINPLHIDSLIADGYAKTSPRGVVYTTAKGDDHITHSLSTKESFLNMFWRYIDFTFPPGSRVLNIAYQAHPELIVYESDFQLDVTILHFEAEQHIATSLVLFLESRAFRAHAVALDVEGDEHLDFVQRCITDSLFTVLFISPAFLKSFREDAAITRLIKYNLLDIEEFVLPVAFPGLNIPFPFKTLGHVKMSNSAKNLVGTLLEQELARPPVLVSSPADLGHLTNEQKGQALLWSLQMYRKSYGRCYVLVTNALQDDLGPSHVLCALSNMGLVDNKIWSADILATAITDKGSEYLRRQLASRRSFIYRTYLEINTEWTDPSPWSLGLEPGTLTVYWKGISIPMSAVTKYEFDVALSFSGKDRSIAEHLACQLKNRGIKVFYDDDEIAKLWGKPLYEYLVDVYRKKARFCVMLISKHYLASRWATLERRAAQDRDLISGSEYILPIRLDDAEVPGLLSTVDYLDHSNHSNEAIADVVAAKLK